MPEAITSFSGEYRWLSNFWRAKVTYDGVTYPSVENAYQAAKTTDVMQRAQFTVCDAPEAKRRGKELTWIRDDWESAKVGVMRKLLQQKFAPGTDLAWMLVGTVEAELVEGNEWGDRFWGVCRGVGANTLGRLLMEQREFLQFYA